MLTHEQTSRLIVGITGASGALYGVRVLEALRDLGIETHLVLTEPAAVTLQQELGLEVAAVRALADHTYALDDWGASIASGSFATRGMIVAPCSIKTLSAIAHSANNNVLVRAADVTLKEGRPLLLLVRETPLHLGHLRLMVQAAEIGAIIFPPAPAFYAHPKTLDDMVRHSVGRMLARIAIANDLYHPWKGVEIE
ncbi:MAG: UbiX family flavin prenyltransferase [Anaerolineae bacterium]|nr:UbiX family flavin prenyltransferase [Anaerolineae bacterium]